MCLLVFSYYFYMSWNPNLVILILFTTVTSYLSAVIISRTSSRKIAKAAMITGVALSLACLFMFKYFNFFQGGVVSAMAAFGFSVQPITLNLLLPVGISFYTFQTLSYVIDVYKGNMKAETHFGLYALYVSFFPQLVAGPIERATSLLPQFYKKQYFSTARLSDGLRQICIGMFKKVVIADFVAYYVNFVYNDITKFGGLSIILATVLFSVQIYCDFSGYSDIAIGSAKILGFDLIQNFKSPYFSKSIKEFWRRWHISLSTWFSDYVYIPLGGSRVKKSRHIFNLLITFILSGLWHGAEYKFIIWGMFHGILLACESFYIMRLDTYVNGVSPLKRGVINAARMAITFTLVNIGWAIFRVNNIADLAYIGKNITRGLNPLKIFTYLESIGFTPLTMAMLICVIVALIIYDWYEYYRGNPLQFIKNQKPMVRYAVYYVVALCGLIGLLSVPIGTSAGFIYFQF
ncbi:MAG: MBOAT family O-acyltransferase [Oscillospiraceae bacterium]